MIQLYFEIDGEERTPEQEDSFQRSLAPFTASWRLLKQLNGRALYHGVILSKVEIDEIISILSSRSPEILGAWNIDGSPFGVVKIVTFDQDTGVYSEGFEGAAVYEYQKNLVESYLDDINSYNENGDIIGIIGKLHHGYSGFKTPAEWGL